MSISLNSCCVTHCHIQDIVNSEKETLWASRRRLTGPGSSPPRCAWKCGRCTPCKPVHVPVPPGNPVTAEYYPEAWRCKCGNRLYMP
ncbi:putative EPIDERMAL PATTERNING FACTOR-like protein [Helianthus anomalus]